jgi:hypothetical protein
MILFSFAMAGRLQQSVHVWTKAASRHLCHVASDARCTVLQIAAKHLQPVQARSGGRTMWSIRLSRNDGQALRPDAFSGCAQQSIDPSLLHVHVTMESGNNAQSKSRRGASRLTQRVSARAKRFDRTLRWSALEKGRDDALYPRELLAAFDDAYNWGEGAVIRFRNRIPAFPESSAYVPRVVATSASYDRYVSMLTMLHGR